MIRRRLATHFWAAEFACRHCGVEGVKRELPQALEELRGRISFALGEDSAIYVTSGFRCENHPLSLKRVLAGLLPSGHTLGLAADCVFGAPLLLAQDQAQKVQAFRRGGIGLYPDNNFLHLEIARPGKMPRRWGRINGEDVSYGEALAYLVAKTAE